jgi:hypothetical protein
MTSMRFDSPAFSTSPAAFDSMKIVCPHVRVRVPRVNIPELPVMNVSIPEVQVDVPGLGPV